MGTLPLGQERDINAPRRWDRCDPRYRPPPRKHIRSLFRTSPEHNMLRNRLLLKGPSSNTGISPSATNRESVYDSCRTKYQRHIARRLGNMTSADEAYHCTMVSTCVAWKIHTTNIQGKHYYLSAMSSSDPAAQLTYFPWLRWEAASPGIFQALTP